MFRFFLPVLGALGLLLVSPFQAGAQSSTSQATSAKRVWTNEDLDQLRAQGLISYFSAPPTVAAAPEVAPTVSEAVIAPPRLQDPEWYAKQAAVLNTQLDLDQAALTQAQNNLAQASDRNTQPGVNLAEGNPGITPDAGIQNLQAQVRQDEDQLDLLSDLARQNGIEPGLLRG